MKWYDIQDIKSKWKPFTFILGARGIGKTYSAFTYVFKRPDHKFIYLRNTDAQIKISMTASGNPFKKWGADHKRDIIIKPGEFTRQIVENDGEDVTEWGLAASLSTFSNMRGVDYTDYDTVIFDEFNQIQALNFNQANAFLDFYESVNRNRELSGEAPVQVFFLSNTQNLNNSIMSKFDIISPLESCIRTGQKRYTRGDIFVELCDSKISSIKKQSVLYRNLPDDDSYKQQAIENKFSNNDFSNIGRINNINEYVPVCNIDIYCVLKHKSKFMFYIRSININDCIDINPKKQKALFMRSIGARLLEAYARNLITFETFSSKEYFITLLNIK